MHGWLYSLKCLELEFSEVRTLDFFENPLEKR
jgi:hypothetical protein